MYADNFYTLAQELSRASNDVLVRAASDGGWRKQVLDDARGDGHSIQAFATPLTCLLATMIKIMPPIGIGFRRALVAQSILDQKAVIW